MAEINIDATNAIVGRLATYVAKQALLGNSVNIFNCESAVISGKFSFVRHKWYLRFFDLGRPEKGPFRSRMPDRFVRRSIRGMLDYKHERGRSAFERVMCYIGVPEKFKDKKLIKVSKEAKSLPSHYYVKVGDLCKSLGGKV
ncbi:50S ribosomal protein L13 [Candidatus Woesearchaeota archaeon]|nr:50S ribosomal protein L13 [Candidatus Woesearchaeota archaeon]MBW3016606.1 50S ribosomal protein L13 [Candidatus Woesearchaeota archaeon]